MLGFCIFVGIFSAVLNYFWPDPRHGVKASGEEK
jgi:hypothetical protein